MEKQLQLNLSNLQPLPNNAQVQLRKEQDVKIGQRIQMAAVIITNNQGIK
jgi:hypothetical protein